MPLTFSIAPLNFNPRSPDGERLQGRIALQVDHEISIHAPRMGSDRGHPGRRTEGPISIHAPRMGSDDRLHHRRTTVLSISIHAPRMGSDCLNSVPFLSLSIFQSTLPGWGATRPIGHMPRLQHHFNPRSPDGERRSQRATTTPHLGNFNPRSPGGERRSTSPSSTTSNAFQSTLPGWGATSYCSSISSCVAFQSTLPGWGATIT